MTEQNTRGIEDRMERMRAEMRADLGEIKTSLNELRKEFKNEYVPQGEYDIWAETTEQQILHLREDMKNVRLEAKERDQRADATRKLAITGLLFPIVTGVTTGLILLLIRTLGG